MSYYTEMEKLRKQVVKDFKHSEKPARNVKKPKKKILVISDPHLPFYHARTLNHAQENHGDADVLVLNGDILDNYSVAKWLKNRMIPLKYEYQMAIELISNLCEMFPKVILVRGNHEDRLQKYFSSKLDPNVSFLVKDDVLELLAGGYDFNDEDKLEKMHHFSNLEYTGGVNGWFTQIGKTIFAHPSGGSGIPMRTAVRTHDHFKARGFDMDCICIGHTHKIGQVMHDDVLLIEQGAACLPMEYSAAPTMGYKPQALGYAVIYQDSKGRVDHNKSGPIYTGSNFI